MGESESPCQLLEELGDLGEAWEAFYQKYYAQVPLKCNSYRLTISLLGGELSFQRTIQVSLSCAARDNSIYVVAALGSLVEGWSQAKKQKEQNFC